MMYNDDQELGDGSYMNPQVSKIEEERGPFDKGEDPEDEVQKEERPLIELENGARYQGEWIEGTNIRQGYGI